RVHRLAVDEHRAGAALPFAAAFFRPGQRAVFTQDIQQPFHRMNGQSSPTSIHHQRHGHQGRGRRAHGRCSFVSFVNLCVLGTCEASITFSGVAGMLRTSYPAWRSALMTAGAGPSIGISPTPFAPNGPCLYGFSSITTSSFGVSSVVGTM